MNLEDTTAVKAVQKVQDKLDIESDLTAFQAYWKDFNSGYLSPELETQLLKKLKQYSNSFHARVMELTPYWGGRIEKENT